MASIPPKLERELWGDGALYRGGDAWLEGEGDPTLGRLFPERALMVPGDVALGGDEGEEFLFLDGSTTGWEGEKRDRYRVPAPNLLDTFLTLADATPKQVLRFAQGWGMLGLCQHDLPPRHAGIYGGEWCGPSRRESIASWRAYSGLAVALLLISAKLHRGEKPSASELEMLAANYPGEPDDPARGAYKASMVEVGAGRSLVSQTLQYLVGAAGLKPVINWSWHTPAVEINLAGHGLIGFLVRELTFAVARVDGVVVCSSCGKPFTPDRSPTRGQHSWCKRKECRRARARHAKRRSRARERRGEIREFASPQISPTRL